MKMKKPRNERNPALLSKLSLQDFLSLTETWLTTKDKDNFHVKGLSLPGYEFNHTPRHGNHGYGGVGVLHKASMKIIKTDVYKSDSFENMQIKFNTGSRCLDLITLV